MNGFAFELPEEFCCNSNPECIHENGIEFISEDESKVINYDFLTSEEISYDALNTLFKEDFGGDIVNYVKTEEFKRIFSGITKADA